MKEEKGGKRRCSEEKQKSKAKVIFSVLQMSEPGLAEEADSDDGGLGATGVQGPPAPWTLSGAGSRSSL